MMQIMKQLTISIFVLTTLAGCATVPSAGTDKDEQAVVVPKSHTKNTILTIGGILLLGAIIANEAENNVRDAVKDANRP